MSVLSIYSMQTYVLSANKNIFMVQVKNQVTSKLNIIATKKQFPCLINFDNESTPIEMKSCLEKYHIKDVCKLHFADHDYKLTTDEAFKIFNHVSLFGSLVYREGEFVNDVAIESFSTAISHSIENMVYAHGLHIYIPIELEIEQILDDNNRLDVKCNGILLEPSFNDDFNENIHLQYIKEHLDDTFID